MSKKKKTNKHQQNLPCSEAVRTEASGDELAARLKSAGASVWTGRGSKVVKNVWAERRDAALADARLPGASVLHVGQV